MNGSRTLAPAMGDTPAIVCRNLAKRFGEIDALRDVSLEVPPGRHV